MDAGGVPCYGRLGTDAGAAAAAPTIIRRIVLPDGAEVEGGQAGAVLPATSE
jgi:hypothetical protein